MNPTTQLLVIPNEVRNFFFLHTFQVENLLFLRATENSSPAIEDTHV